MIYADNTVWTILPGEFMCMIAEKRYNGSGCRRWQTDLLQEATIHGSGEGTEALPDFPHKGIDFIDITTVLKMQMRFAKPLTRCRGDP